MFIAQNSRRLAHAYTVPHGFRIAYHHNIANHCPACGNSHWHIGRQSAQCAFCDTALPFAQTG